MYSYLKTSISLVTEGISIKVSLVMQMWLQIFMCNNFPRKCILDEHSPLLGLFFDKTAFWHLSEEAMFRFVSPEITSSQWFQQVYIHKNSVQTRIPQIIKKKEKKTRLLHSYIQCADVSIMAPLATLLHKQEVFWNISRNTFIFSLKTSSNSLV